MFDCNFRHLPVDNEPVIPASFGHSSQLELFIHLFQVISFPSGLTFFLAKTNYEPSEEGKNQFSCSTTKGYFSLADLSFISYFLKC